MNNDYSNYAMGGSFGTATAGFGSRGKASHIGNITTDSNVPMTQRAVLIHRDGNSTARTSRSHLLANLRTAPRGSTAPSSAPPTKLRYSINDGLTAADGDSGNQVNVPIPQTATASMFPMQSPMYNTMTTHLQQMMPLPAMGYTEAFDAQKQVDVLAAQYNQLMQQQLRLQQQLLNVTAAASQFQQMDLTGGLGYGQVGLYATGAAAPGLSMYPGQLQQGIAGYSNTMAGAQAGLYQSYNPLANQLQYGQTHLGLLNGGSIPYTSQVPFHDLASVPKPPTPTVKVSPPPPEDYPTLPQMSAETVSRLSSIANLSGTKDDLSGLKKGHKKVTSLALNRDALSQVTPGPRTSQQRANTSIGTPMTSTFKPSQQKQLEHPTRQPRGPPSMEELLEKPTSAFEGSKNFAVFQRRRAFNSLLKAGHERRTVRGSSSTGSLTPPSESDTTFSPQSENDSASSKSADLSGKPSFGSLRIGTRGAIGSEMEKALKERSRERGSIDSSTSNSSAGSLGSSSIHGSIADVNTALTHGKTGRMQSILPIAGAADKRKSLIFHSTKPSIGTLFG